MALLPYARQRLASFIVELDRSAEGDFPYQDSKLALGHLKALFEEKHKRLEGFDETNAPDVVMQQCRLALRDLFIYLPLVGFILRSTTTRNAFEAFGPFLRLAVDILEPGVSRFDRKTKLLLSSEWDYSPFTYHTVSDLEGFLFIGLPAPESGNPLLVPLAGHELGHAVWHAYSIRNRLKSRAQAEVVKAIEANWQRYLQIFQIKIDVGELTTNLVALETWARALEWCLRQAEESFCDFLGLRIFGESYLRAFGYILSPGYGNRSERYPEMRSRVDHLLRAASKYQIDVPPDFTDLFDKDEPLNVAEADKFRIQLADQALENLLEDLISESNGIAEKAGLSPSSPDEVNRVLQRLRQIAPPEQCKTMADILNAGWKAYGDDDLWKEHPALQARRVSILKELVLKSLEIFEIERIQSE